jgi:anti-sigma factor RsiW
MMDLQDQLRLQSFLDGELPEAQAAEVANRLAKDPAAAALITELRQTRQSMAGFDKGVSLPESREFFWSKIEREIERAMPPAVERTGVPLYARLSRILMPAAGMAMVVIAGLMGARYLTGGSAASPFETSFADDGGAFTYHDYSAGATLVWLSYPSEDEVAADEDDSEVLD